MTTDTTSETDVTDTTDLAKLFARGPVARVDEVLQTLALTDTARRLRGGKFVAS